jgi:CheY-like chemotaxis protein
LEKPFVLIADDNDATCTLIMALLRRDYQVETARDGMEAIARLKRRRYAVVILDLLMPMVDGYAVLDFLRAEDPEALGRVLVLTASLAPREMQRVSEYSVCNVIAKPFEVDLLTAEVRKCATGSNDDDADPKLRGTLIATGMLLLLAAATA